MPMGLAPYLNAVWPGWVDYNPSHKVRRAVESAGIGFVHVPKCGGISVVQTLYGFNIGHLSWRWYRRLDVPTVAVVRDPIDRFLSAFDFFHSEGRDKSDRLLRRTYACPDVNHFVENLRHSAHLRAYFYFRPQSYFVAHRGRLMVDEILPITRLSERFPGIPHLNRTTGQRTPRSALSDTALDTLHTIYVDDYAL